MRLIPASSAAELNDLNDRVTPGSPSEVEEKLTRSVPKNAASAAEAAPLNELCPEVYAGNGGVGNSGIHVGSLSRIAVTGRHTSNRYLQSQHTIAASAIATFNSANSRVLSIRFRFRSAATVCAMRFQCPGGVTVPSPSAQKCAISVCSFVRVEFVAAPRARTSRSAAAYASESSFGGAGGRNAVRSVTAKPATFVQPGRSGSACAGGVG